MKYHVEFPMGSFRGILLGIISHATSNRKMYGDRGRYVTRKMVQDERVHSLIFYFLYYVIRKEEEEWRHNNNNRPINLPKVI